MSTTSRFHDLHHLDEPLVLPNAWDHASAMLFAQAGFQAVGTTSLGVAAAMGAPDASGLARDATSALARMLRTLPCPVTIDVEDGFSPDPAEVADSVATLRSDGINLEDGTGGSLSDPARHAEKITAVKERCPALFVNARVDTYWLGEKADVAETLRRAHAYVDAGADGIFIPGNLDLEDLEVLCREIPRPVNALASARHPVPALADVGVRRVSTGSLLYRAALQTAVDVAANVAGGGLAPSVISYADVDALAIQ